MLLLLFAWMNTSAYMCGTGLMSYSVCQKVMLVISLTLVIHFHEKKFDTILWTVTLIHTPKMLFIVQIEPQKMWIELNVFFYLTFHYHCSRHKRIDLEWTFSANENPEQTIKTTAALYIFINCNEHNKIVQNSLINWWKEK